MYHILYSRTHKSNQKSYWGNKRNESSFKTSVVWEKETIKENCCITFVTVGKGHISVEYFRDKKLFRTKNF